MRDSLNFLHFDLDAFFASCEELERPELKGRPMVVGGRSHRGIITTANYEARKYGLHSAMPIFQAKSLCPHVIIVPTRHHYYGKKSAEVFEILNGFSSRIEKMSVDEGAMDISEIDRDPEDLAEEIQQKVFRETGLTLSIGISYNKFLAKLASDWNKPQGMMIITKDMMPEILLPLPVGKVAGVGRKTELKLHNMGIYSVADLMEIPLETLTYHFGKQGHVMYDRIRGIDLRKVETSRMRKSLGIERTYEKDLTDREQMKGILKDYCEELEIDLRRHHFVGKTVSLKIKYYDFTSLTRNFTLMEYTRDANEIYQKIEYLFDQLEIKKPVRLMGVTMSQLRDDDIEQLHFTNLF
ncbi:MAG: DNA polymerase IV [Gallicola sp.]|nr:DNA polymerase IV [Gallicola sp.]